MNSTLDEWMKLILGSTGALAVLIAGIKWLDRDRSKVLKALEVERDGRIRVLEDHAKRCDADKAELQKQAVTDRTAADKKFTELYAEIINIYKTRGQQTRLNQETANLQSRKESDEISTQHE